MPDLSDCPYNKLLRSKIIGKDAVGIGEEPKGGIGRLLVRGSKSLGHRQGGRTAPRMFACIPPCGKPMTSAIGACS
jgi:hypothetical protein